MSCHHEVNMRLPMEPRWIILLVPGACRVCWHTYWHEFWMSHKQRQQWVSQQRSLVSLGQVTMYTAWHWEYMQSAVSSSAGTWCSDIIQGLTYPIAWQHGASKITSLASGFKQCFLLYSIYADKKCLILEVRQEKLLDISSLDYYNIITMVDIIQW